MSAWVSRGLFPAEPGQIFHNHESYRYVYRMVEFRECLASGDWSPQWCVNFRGGLGSPYFSYYQPGFFYAGCVFPSSLPSVWVLGGTVFAFSLLGFLAVALLMGRRFGLSSGFLSASALLLSVYACSELYIRGDFSEYCAMMTFAAALCALLIWLEEGRLSAAVGLAILTGAQVVLHPCIGLAGGGMLALVVLAHGVMNWRWQRVVGAFVALGVGSGLAAFYWLPIATEWDLVQANRGFRGFYNYSRHFLTPLDFIGPYDRDQSIIPFTFGPILPAVVLLNGIVMVLRRKHIDPAQVRLFALTVAVLIASLFLMTRLSDPIWSHLKILQRLQFPWRLLSVATVAVVCAAGAFLAGSRPLVRGLAALALVIWMCYQSIAYTAVDEIIEFEPPASASQIAELEFFKPDRKDEWLPRGAQVKFAGDRAPQQPVVLGKGRVSHYQRTASLLSCDVKTRGDTTVTLPHYYFPVGWTATLDGVEVELQPDEQGLMCVSLPGQNVGKLEVRFSQTPMRRMGLWISATFAALGVLLVYWVRIRRQRSDSSSSR
jgi:hypothetical protein